MPEISPFDTYEIYDTVGEGGGGTVFKAFHKRLQKYVVIKKIHANIQEDAERRAEVDILKNLHHPYLPQVFDYFEAENIGYVVIDFIQGESFGQKLARGERFSERKILKYAKQICEALSYLHSQPNPVIHGDIKPDNIMLTPEDNVCLIDFNISGVAREGHAVTVGYTEGYCAPEQYREFQQISKLMTSGADYLNNSVINKEGAGRTEILKTVQVNGAGRTEILNPLQANGAGRTEILNSVQQMPTALPEIYISIDKRSDIYSLGATLFHMYTGHMLGMKSENQISGKTSEGFIYILNKALQENPDERYQDAGQMLNAINQLYKRDSRYRNMKVRHALSYILCISVGLLGIYFILHGRDVYREELLAKYDNYVEELTDAREKQEEIEFSRLYEQATELMPERIEAYYQKALYLFDTRQYEETVKYVTKTLNENSVLYEQDAVGEMYYIMGTAYFELEEYGDASNAFANAVKYDENNPIYYSDEAIALARVGKTDSAKSVLNEAENKGALSGNVYLVQGEIKLAEGDLEGAQQDLSKSIKDATDDYTRMRAYVMCAKAIQEQGDSIESVTEGIDLLTEALNILPKDYYAMILEQLTNMYMKGYEASGDKMYAENAIETLDEISTLGWATYTTYDNMVNIYYQIGDYAAGTSLLEEMAQKYQDNYKVPMKQAFFEASIQGEKEQKDRDYNRFAEYYNKAQEMYATVKRDGWSDTEMQVLEKAYEELKNGHWID